MKYMINIIPSIDLKDGTCVRLTQGDFTKVSNYQPKPEEVAYAFSNAGASTLHIVDLDGAKSGKISQIDCIKSIRQNFNGIMQVGGGIRSDNNIDILLNIGINRLVIGSNALLNIEITKEWIKKYSADVIVLAVDFKIEKNIPYLAIKGWQEQTQKSLWNILNLYPEILHVLCTDINKDGMEQGPNLKFYQEIKTRYPNLKIQASGGISTIKDILELEKLGLDGAIIGKALHENKLNLKEAILCLK